MKNYLHTRILFSAINQSLMRVEWRKFQTYKAPEILLPMHLLRKLPEKMLQQYKGRYREGRWYGMQYRKPEESQYDSSMFKRSKKGHVALVHWSPRTTQALTSQSPLTWSTLWLNSCSLFIWPGLELSPSVKGFLVTWNKCHPNC